MITTTYHLEPSHSLPFHVLGNRYTTHPPRDTGNTLVFLHATGLHKETWEPLIARLFALSTSAQSETSIREAWAIDFPNHGESAVLNDAVLDKLYPHHWDGYIYPKLVHAFLLSRPGGIDLTQHALVGVGHSVGGNALILTTTLAPALPWRALQLLDASIGTSSPARDHADRTVTRIAWSRMDTWASRAAARTAMERMLTYRSWDPEVRERFVEKGLRLHPAAQYPDPYAFDGVMLACSRPREAASYKANQYEAAFEALQQVYRRGPPVHCILARHDELGSREVMRMQLRSRHGRERTMDREGRASIRADAAWTYCGRHLGGSRGCGPTCCAAMMSGSVAFVPSDVPL